MPSETSAVNAAYIEARMKQFKLVDMREQYQELIRVASEQSMTYEDFLIMLLQAEETGKNANYVQTECQFRYCGTAIPFLTVRSTAR